MPDKRLIDANALMKNIGKIPQLRGITYSRMKKVVEEAPTIDAVPVVHGRWILESKGNFSPGGFEIEEKCSECGRYVYRYEGQPQDNYCPNCGAKMGGHNDTD